MDVAALKIICGVLLIVTPIAWIAAWHFYGKCKYCGRQPINYVCIHCGRHTG